MAVLYPNNINLCKSPAEKRLFNIFKTFSDEYHIIHSLSWLSGLMVEETNRFSPEGEIDFVIINKKFGILCIEVKGGRITYKNHAYFTTGGIPIKDPYLQARDNAHYLRKNISSILNKTLIGYAVGTPDTIAPKLSDDHSTVTFDLEDINKLENKIESIFLFWKRTLPSKRSLSEHELESLIDYLLPSSIDELNNKILYDNKTWLSLSDQQVDSLDYALNNDRSFIFGRAGTGKTILAIILARILSKDFNILFLTFNRIISDKISEELSGIKNIQSCTFHKFLKNYNNIENISNPVKNENEILKSIIDKIENPFDVLIIDEAQSFSSVWLTSLNNYFKNKKIYIFSDELQSFSHEGKIDNNQMKKIFSVDAGITLTLNYRSPYKVYKRLLEMFISPFQQTTPRNLDVLDLKEIITDNPRKSVIDNIDSLKKENISNNDIIILVSSIEKSNLERFSYDNIEVEKVQRYRGMEKPIVIYILTSGSERDLHELYVAYSRSTTQTIVIIPEMILDRGKSIFEKILIESTLTENHLKENISSRVEVFTNKLLSTYEKANFKNFNVYFNEKYFFFSRKNHNFIELLLMDYLDYKSILCVRLSETNLNNALLLSSNLLEKKVYNLTFDYCKSCNSQSYKHYDYCLNCNKDKFEDIESFQIIDSFELFYSISKDKQVDDSEINDSFRSLGRIIFNGIIDILSEKTLNMLNLQSNIKYVSGIIEFLIFIYYEKKNKHSFTLEELRNSKKIKQLNSMDDNWTQSSGYCNSIFLKHKLFQKVEKAKTKTYTFNFNDLFKTIE